jgi:hypothetical protein
LLKVFGLVVRKTKGKRFEELVRAAIIDQPWAVAAIVEPLLTVPASTRAQVPDTSAFFAGMFVRTRLRAAR